MKCRESFTCWGDIHFVVLFAGGRQKDHTHTEQSNEGCTPQSCMSAASCFPAQGHTWGMGSRANMRFEVLQLGRGYEATGNGSSLFHMTGELLDRWDICRLRKKKNCTKYKGLPPAADLHWLRHWVNSTLNFLPDKNLIPLLSQVTKKMYW